MHNDEWKPADVHKHDMSLCVVKGSQG